MTPFNYRPDHTGEDEPMDWEDNAVSNAMAWVSDRLFPRWCKSQEHWTNKVADYFWAQCACCLFFRGVLAGVAIGLATQLVF
jgi:hypothetical protein